MPAMIKNRTTYNPNEEIEIHIRPIVGSRSNRTRADQGYNNCLLSGEMESNLYLYIIITLNP